MYLNPMEVHAHVLNPMYSFIVNPCYYSYFVHPGIHVTHETACRLSVSTSIQWSITSPNWGYIHILHIHVHLHTKYVLHGVNA